MKATAEVLVLLREILANLKAVQEKQEKANEKTNHSQKVHL